MTSHDARRILGLGPDDDPRLCLEELRLAQERIAALVRGVSDPILADRYQEGLLEFERALDFICEFPEAPEIEISPPSTEKLEVLPLIAIPALAIESEPADISPIAPESRAPRRRTVFKFIWIFMVLTAIGAGLSYYQNEERKILQRQARIALLEREGLGFVENRRWQDASRVFTEIDALAPNSEMVRLGRRSIEVGITEEQTQFIGYWTGQAIAELESVRLDEAQAAIRRVLEKFPADAEAAAILARITAARASQSRDAAISDARKQFDDRKWDEAIRACRLILSNNPNDTDAQSILTESTAALEKHSTDQANAKKLFDQAIARDQGQFDAQALNWLRDAAVLAPDNPEIAARLEKMASYTRTLRVPEDFATPAEALAAARDRDRIVLSEQIWKGVLVVNAAIELQGAGFAKTIVECSATEGSPITIGPDAKGARISGITFRHESFHALGKDRFSAALVRGGIATFVDCRFIDASGHGLVVTEQGSANVSRCRFADNGWNGVAAIGKGSVLDVRDSEALNNFEHGIETWAGAGATLLNNRCEANCLNGIHIDNGTAAAIVDGNQLIANREFGLVIDSAGGGKITNNVARSNLLGGVVIRAAAAALPVTGNQVTLNLGPGMVLEKGLVLNSYAVNSVTKNTAQQILADANLPEPEEPKEALPDLKDH